MMLWRKSRKPDELLDGMKSIEEALYQTKNQSRQDPLNFPIRLNNKLAALGSTVSVGDYRPTDQSLDVKTELITQINEQLNALDNLLSTELPVLNDVIRDNDIPAIILPAEEEDE